jgi:FkbM family methyltransferase
MGHGGAMSTANETMSEASPGGGARNGLEQARRAVLEGPALGWEAPSRFGRAGLLARRALQRAMRPYDMRQREVDQALFGAISQSAASAASRIARLELMARAARESANAVTLDPAEVIDATTVAGPLWLNRADTLVTPGIESHGMYEAHVTALMHRLLRPGMTFVDVGANIGYFSVLASKLVGPEGLVVAVEPGPANLALLRANLWRNACSNALVLPIAAYTHRGHVQLVLNPEGGAGNWVQAGDVPAPSILVPCAPLDELLEGQRVDVLKTDAEGSDVQAIRGMEATIRRSAGITIVAEFWVEAYGGRGEAPSEVLDYYSGLGLGKSLLRDTGEVEPTDDDGLLGLAGSVPFVNIVMA